MDEHDQVAAHLLRGSQIERELSQVSVFVTERGGGGIGYSSSWIRILPLGIVWFVFFFSFFWFCLVLCHHVFSFTNNFMIFSCSDLPPEEIIKSAHEFRKSFLLLKLSPVPAQLVQTGNHYLQHKISALGILFKLESSHQR